MGTGKKLAIGALSTFSWFVLALAIFTTSANFVVNGLSHVGASSSKLIKDVASSPKALNSIIDEIAKNADPDTAKQIEKNRVTINKTLASLGNSEEFRTSIATTLDHIAQAVLNGDSSVQIDFSHIAALVAYKVNSSAKSSVISKKDLAKVEPKTLDLTKSSKVVKNIKDGLHKSYLLWLLWLALLIGLYFLKGKRVVRTFGIQLLSVGILALFIRFGAPLLYSKAISDGATADYQKELIPKGFDLLSTPALIFGGVVTALGVALFLVDFFTHKKRMANVNKEAGAERG